MDRKKNITLIVMFIGMIYFIAAVNIIAPDKESSEVENRELQQLPTISDMKSGDFSQLMDSYCSDQFFMRDFLLEFDIRWKLLTGKTQINGHYIANDGWILGQNEQSEQSNEDIKIWSEKIYEISKKAKEKGMDVFYCSLPHKVNTLDFMYPEFVDKKYGMSNEKRMLSSIEKKGIKTINIGEYFKKNFTEEELKNMYFKTDHHWNSLGAYNAFRYFIEKYSEYEKIDISLDESNYNLEWLNNREFDGSYNRNLAYIFPKKENIPVIDSKLNYEYYTLENGKFKEISKERIVGTGRKNKELSYEEVYTGNEECYKIVNNKSKTDRSILVIRDSYEAAMTGMLSEVFRNVYIVDPRVGDFNFDYVLSHCNADNLVFMFNNGLVMDDMLSYFDN